MKKHSDHLSGDSSRRDERGQGDAVATPLTDALWGKTRVRYDGLIIEDVRHALTDTLNHARQLERDRAELIEALGTMRLWSGQVSQRMDVPAGIRSAALGLHDQAKALLTKLR